MERIMQFVLRIFSNSTFRIILCTIFLNLAILSIRSSQAFGALGYVPDRIWDGNEDVGNSYSFPFSIVNQMVLMEPSSDADPSSSTPRTITKKTIVTDIKLPSRRFKVMLNAGAGYGAIKPNLRIFSDGGQSGLVMGGSLRYAYSRSAYFGLSYRRQLGDEAFEYLGEQDVINSLDWDISVDEFLFIVGWTLSASDKKSLITYVDIGAGALRIAQSATESDGTSYEEADWNKTFFSFMITGGGIIPLSEGLGLNIEGDWITAIGSNIEWKSLFGIRIGAAVMLGGS
jgi:hypothetical protein